MNMYTKFQLHLPYGFWEEHLLIYFENLPFMLSWQPIKFSNLDKIHMNHRGLLKKHFGKKNLNICRETAKIANFHFPHYKSVEIKLGSKYNLLDTPLQFEMQTDLVK